MPFQTGMNNPNYKPVEQRFWAKVGPHDDPTKCWLWIAGKDGCGYGTFNVDGRKVGAHRFSYELHYHTIIPVGMTIDHVKARGCASRCCVNPYHLEVVTLKINVHRSADAPAAKNAKKMYCAQGHPFNKENTYVYPHGRVCRECHSLGMRAWYIKKKTQQEVCHV